MSRAAAFLLLLALCGCSAKDIAPGRWDSGGEPADQMLPDGLADCPPPSSLNVILDSYPDPTCLATQPFRGKAPGADRVVVLGGTGQAQPAQVSSDGTFCIEVTLKTDEINSLSFSAVDSRGCPGQTSTYKIEHKSCSRSDAGSASASINAALGATVNSPNPAQGDRSYLVDGNLNTVVKYEGGWALFDANIQVDIALAKAADVQQIIVRWDAAQGNGCDYGQKYKLYASTSAGPGEVGQGGWSLVSAIDGGDGGEDSFSVSSLTGVQHVGLVLNSNGCTGWSEGFLLREVEVWAPDPAAPVVPTDRCL